MSVVLWPRQEVLQLVIPHLGNVGKGLNQFNAFHAVNKLSKLQNKSHQIRYEDWFSVAKEGLKWNDHCASLFWEMLATATTYLHPEVVASCRQSMMIDIECVVIFLAMHIMETNSTKPAAPAVAFEAVWPLNENGEVYPSSPVASPSSPVKDMRTRAVSPLASPMSPRSPLSSPQKPQSPRTMSPAATRTPRASTQHLHSVRQKIPIILRALNSSDVDHVRTVDAEELEFHVSRRVTDALGMVLCGGQSRDQTASPLSSLHPAWSGENEHSTQSLAAKEFVAWVNQHLSMNDMLYPAPQAPAMLESLDEGPKETKAHHPQRVMTPVGALSRFSPTVISAAAATTIVHVVTSGFSRTSSFRSRHADSRIGQRPNTDAALVDPFDADVDLGGLEIVTADPFESDHSATEKSPQKSTDLLSTSLTLDDLAGDKPGGAHSQRLELTLPQLFLNYCTRSKLYMASPYYSATVTGCSDCDIVIGGVYGALIVNGCDRVRITAACRRLVVTNCLECEFQVATMSPSIIVGDCRSLSFGPHNTNYRNLRQHLKLAELSPLLGNASSSSANAAPAAAGDGVAANMWAALCDVNTCLDLTGHNALDRLVASAAAGAAAGSAIYELPAPLSSTAAVQPTDKFRALVVPFKSEFAALESSPLALPREYKIQLVAQKLAVEETKQALVGLLAAPKEGDSAKSGPMRDGEQTKEDLDSKLMSSSLLAKRFMEWMVATDSIQEVLDLIRLESDKPAGAHPH